MINREGDFSFGAAYQSVLSNIRWIDNGKESPFIKQLQVAMSNDNIDSERLSIRFNLDMFENDPKKSTFTMGRVTGTPIFFCYSCTLCIVGYFWYFFRFVQLSYYH